MDNNELQINDVLNKLLEARNNNDIITESEQFTILGTMYLECEELDASREYFLQSVKLLNYYEGNDKSVLNKYYFINYLHLADILFTEDKYQASRTNLDKANSYKDGIDVAPKYLMHDELLNLALLSKANKVKDAKALLPAVIKNVMQHMDDIETLFSEYRFLVLIIDDMKEYDTEKTVLTLLESALGKINSSALTIELLTLKLNYYKSVKDNKGIAETCINYAKAIKELENKETEAASSIITTLIKGYEHDHSISIEG